MSKPFNVHFTNPLDHFKQAGAAGDAVGFQRRRHCQTDGFFCTALIRHHQIGSQRIKSPVHAFHGCIK